MDLPRMGWEELIEQFYFPDRYLSVQIFKLFLKTINTGQTGLEFTKTKNQKSGTTSN